MRPFLIFLLLKLCFTGFAQQNTDSLDKVNAKTVKLSGNYITKAIIEKDSSIWLRADMKRDHRFFGYQKPDTRSRRMILFSIFTNDVEKNPFECIYGSYYETSGLPEGQRLVFISRTGNFIKARLEGVYNDDTGDTIIYFEKKWFAFHLK